MRDKNVSGITSELLLLRTLSGAGYSKQVEQIAKRGEFFLLRKDSPIYICGGQESDDFKNLLNAAHKLVSHNYTVYILPNPKDFRTPDFILKRKGIFRIYDLKTIQGKASAKNRLIESIGQTNRVILNMRCKYEAVLLAADIVLYFQRNLLAMEVVVLKGNKMVPIKRKEALGKNFVSHFRKAYEK